MKQLLEYMSNQTGFVHLQPAPEAEIRAAEQKLNLSFAEDYRDYVSAYGAASFCGHELTGVCNSKRLNVTDVTAEERQYQPNLPADWYVIEEAGIDGIVIWQSESGEVYQSWPDEHWIKVGNSITEYLSLTD